MSKSRDISPVLQLHKGAGSRSVIGDSGSLEHSVETDLSMRSAETVCPAILAAVLNGEKPKASIRSIMESLVWIFVCYRSRSKNWLPPKKRHRLVNSLRRTYRNIQSVANDMYQEYDFVKYFLDCQLCDLAQHLDLYPTKPSCCTVELFEGYCRRIVKKAIHRHQINDELFILSLQKGSKKIWEPKDGPECLETSDQKYKSRLIREPKQVSSPMKETLISCAQEVFGPLLNNCLSATGQIPSHKACWEKPASQGGAQALFHALKIPDSFGIKRNDFEEIGGKGLSVLRPITSKIAVEDELPSQRADEETIQNLGSIRSWNEQLGEYLDYVHEDAVRKAYENRVLLDTHENPLATRNRVARVMEPGGKIRYVSCGDGYTYTALLPLQKNMLKCWKQRTESTMLQSDLTEAIQQIDQSVHLPYWCSVDYEAATDYLERDCTFCCLRPLLQNKVDLADLAWRSFEPGTGILPSGEEFTHVNGQLMGHVLSFPLLCIENLAVYRQSIDLWIEQGPNVLVPWGGLMKPRRSLRNVLLANVKINGDDMVFKCDKPLYETFKKVASSIGFRISQGKNYLSENFCMMNSQFYVRHGDMMKRAGYLNLQLVRGISAKKGISDATPDQIGLAMNDMVKFCPWAQCTIPAALHAAESKCKFSSEHHLGMNRSWFGHPDLGGFGVDPKYAPKNWVPTREQRKIAAILISSDHERSIDSLRVPNDLLGRMRNILHLKHVYHFIGPLWSNGSLSPSTELLKDSELFNRLLMYVQASVPNVVIKSRGSINVVQRVINTFGNPRRLHPMSVEHYKNYKAPLSLVTRVSGLPPLPLVKPTYQIEPQKAIWSKVKFRNIDFVDQRNLSDSPIVAGSPPLL